MRIHTPLSLAAVLALGFAWGPVHAATPAADATISLGPAYSQHSEQTGSTYYLQRIPGTDKVRRVYDFDRLDADHNGQLSRGELPKDMHDLRSHFLEADWNHNGQLSAQEYLMYRNHTAPMYTAISHGMIFISGSRHVDAGDLAGL